MSLSIKAIETFVQRVSKYAKLCEKESILFTKKPSFNNINSIELKFTNNIDEFVPLLAVKQNKTMASIVALENTNPDIAYHGSPFDFNIFDVNKIGSGEGFSKRGKGIYLHRSKKMAPYFANIRSEDAPIHLGCNKCLENPKPHVYEVANLSPLNLQKVSSIEAKKIASRQSQFETANPHIDGLELQSGEICVFPKSISKLQIKNKQGVETFVSENKGYNFRSWTTNETRLTRLT